MDVAKKIETKLSLKDYFYIVKKRVWTVVLIAMFILVSVSIATFKQKKLYMAKSRILIEYSASNIVSFQDINKFSGYNEYFETQYEIIKSRMVALEVVDRLFPNENLTEDERIARADAIRAKIIVNPVKGTNLVDLAMMGPDPKEVARLVNLVTDVYIEKSLEDKVNSYKTASSWLDDQITSVIVKMKKAEFDLQKYREQKQIISPKIEERQSNVIAELNQVTRELQGLRSRKLELEIALKQIKELRDKGIDIDETTLPEVLQGTGIQAMRGQIYALTQTLYKLKTEFGEKHPEVLKVKAQIDAINKNIQTEIDKVINRINNQYELLKAKEKLYNERKKELNNTAIGLLERSIQYNILNREVEINRNLYDYLLKRAGEINVTGSMRFNNISLVDKATVPKKPISPNVPRNLILGAVVGLIFGLGFAFFLEYLDETIRSLEDVEHYLNLPILGFVPNIHSYMKKRSQRVSPELITYTHPKSTVSECYRAVRTNILFSTEVPPKVIMVTSSTPGEGKTVSAVNIAIAMAQSEKKVLLMDGDLRRSRIHDIFRLENKYGLSTLLTDENIDAFSLIVKSSITNLNILPSGPVPKNPAELLMKERMKSLIKIYKDNFDIIIIDAPPVVPVTDPSIISKYSDVVCLVVRSGVTAKNIVEKNAKRFLDLDVKRLNVLLNDVRKQDSDYYYSEYYYSYYKKEEELHQV
ncbi:MAG: polysaccharide biosynthesis tyrosine autokinase [Candidatus Schekmanbacteria bacterium]|nr:MAG: polysaccharide biosynthesis tyrosine autokinase [Candidatus Schekmanbacteria bacterium]